MLGPFVHGRLQNLQTSEVSFAHVITPLTDPTKQLECIVSACVRIAIAELNKLLFLLFTESIQPNRTGVWVLQTYFIVIHIRLGSFYCRVDGKFFHTAMSTGKKSIYGILLNMNM